MPHLNSYHLQFSTIFKGPFATSAPGGGVLGLVNSNFPASSTSTEINTNTSNQTTMRIGDKQSNISMPSMGADQSMKHQMLSREEWFHGPISRKDAEQLLLEVYNYHKQQ